jgi:hypothetical protein
LFFILSLLYLTASTGADLHLHYCMGHLSDWSIWINNDEKKCSKCGMEKQEEDDNGCCRDEQKWVKIEDDQKANLIIEPPSLTSEDINYLHGYTVISFFNISNDLLPQSNAPPRKKSVATYILNSNFRI